MKLPLLLAVLSASSCTGCGGDGTQLTGDRKEQQLTKPAPDSEEEAFYGSLRALMVQSQIEARGIRDPEVLRALRKVPRHRFVPPSERHQSYDDHPVLIGGGQTASQPYIVALMTEESGITRRKQGKAAKGGRPAHPKVLEIGTGSGYQAAVLAECGARVFSIEIIESLARRALEVLKETGYSDRITVRVGDGYRGWPEEAPFDAVLVTAAPDHIPEPLYEQLAMGGVLVIPVGDLHQELLVIEKTPEGRKQRTAGGVRFVPMRGEAERKGR